MVPCANFELVKSFPFLFQCGSIMLVSLGQQLESESGNVTVGVGVRDKPRSGYHLSNQMYTGREVTMKCGGQPVLNFIFGIGIGQCN